MKGTDLDLKDYKSLLDFLQMLQNNELLSDAIMPKKVIYADDQFINQKSVERNFQDLGIAGKLITMNDGKDVIEYFEKCLPGVNATNEEIDNIPA